VQSVGVNLAVAALTHRYWPARDWRNTIGEGPICPSGAPQNMRRSLSLLALTLFLTLILGACAGFSSGTKGSGDNSSGNNGGGNGSGGGTNGGGTGGGGATGSGGGAADFYVATNGNDSWSGSLPAPNSNNSDGPFANIARAQQAVREILQNPRGRSTPLVVQLRQGTYYSNQTLTFTSADSGTSQLPVVWENYPDEIPILSGGLQLGTGSGFGWKNTSGNSWQLTLPSSAQYFEQLFYNGQRRLRPRLGGSLGAYYRVAATVYLPGNSDPNCSIFVSGKGYECFDRFQYDPSDPISTQWKNLTSPYPAGDIELYDFEEWNVAKLRVESVDTTNHIVHLTGPTYQANGYFGFIPGHRYLLENVKDSLGQAGQWFLDRSSSPWTLTYLANPGENPNDDSVIVPQAAQVLNANGLKYVTFQGLSFEHDNFVVPAAGYPSLRQDPGLPGAVTCTNCSNVTFDGDTVTQTAGGGIEFYTTNTSSTTAENTIQDSAIYDVGGFGIRVGMPNVYTDTDSNVPHGTLVENTLIAGYGRVFPSAIGIVQGDAHDNTYTHNDIYDGYHSAIEICSLGCVFGVNGHGAYNNTISFNHAYAIGQGMTNDLGCIYLNTGNPNNYATGNAVLNNRCHDIVDASTQDADGFGGQGIYLDAQTAGVTVENNLVYRTASQPMNISNGPVSGAPANTIRNNIFALGRVAMIAVSNPYLNNSCAGMPVLQFNASSNIFYFDRSNQKGGGFLLQRGCTYACGSPYPNFENFSSNLYWRTDGSFLTDPDGFHVQHATTNPLCDTLNLSGNSWTYYTFSQWQGLGEDVQGAVKNPGFPNPGCNQSTPRACVATSGQDNFSLAASPGVGFVVFDPREAGRQNPVLQAPAIAPTFLTAPLNPATDF